MTISSRKRHCHATGQDYYPVRLGQIFNDRYKSIGKLGYGTASTV